MSDEEFNTLVTAFNNGTADLDRVTVREWIEVSYLAMFNAESVDINVGILVGGNVIRMHSCIEGVVPPGDVKELKRKH